MTWTAVKERLSKNAAWLHAFAEPIDIAALPRIQSRLQNSPFAYDCLLLEQLLTDVSALVERCLSYRREARDLEIASVRTCLDYEEFTERSKLDEELELLGVRFSQISREQAAYTKAASEFDKGKEPLGRGNFELASGQSNVAGLDLTDAATRKELISKRWAITRRIREEYQRRHTEPGNAHNYKWRMDRIVELYAEDVAEAYQKALSVSDGLKVIYAHLTTPPKPNADNPRYLDDLVSWTRDVIRFVECESQYEAQYELVLPLVQPWRWHGKPIVEPNDFRERFKKHDSNDADFPLIKINFSLNDVFHHQDRVRLASIGLTFATDFVDKDGLDGNMAGDSYARVRATIKTPEQASPLGPAAKYRKPPVILGSVSVFSGNTPLAVEGGPLVHNISPVGDWEIVFEPLITWKEEDRKALYYRWFNNVVRDVKLHLRVISKPHSSAESAFRP